MNDKNPPKKITTVTKTSEKIVQEINKSLPLPNPSSEEIRRTASDWRRAWSPSSSDKISLW